MSPEHSKKVRRKERIPLIDYGLLLLGSLYRSGYDGPRQIITLDRAAEECGLNLGIDRHRRGLLKALTEELPDIFKPVLRYGKICAWSYNPGGLRLISPEESLNYERLFKGHNPYFRQHTEMGHKPLKATSYDFVFTQENASDGSVRYRRIY